MLMKKIFNLMIIAFAMMLVASCSNGASEVLKMVPAKADAVIVADIDGVLSDFGISISEEDITLPEELDALIGNDFSKENRAQAAKILSKVKTTIDCSCVVGFRTSDGTNYGIVRVKDADMLNEVLTKELGTAKDIDGFKVYDASFSAPIVAIKDNVMWISDMGNNVDGIKNQINAAKEKSITAVKGVGSFLSSDENLKVVVSTNLMGQYAKVEKDGWIRCYADIDGFNLKIELSMVDSAGDEVKLNADFPEKLDGDILAKIPEDAVGAVAFPMNKKVVESIEMALKSFMEGNESPQYAMAKPYLESIDGTVMFAVSATDLSSEQSVKNPKNLKCVAMIPMAEDKIDALLTLAATQVGQGVAKDGEFYVISKDGLNVKFGKLDGCLAVLFGDNIKHGGSSLEDVMKGGYSAIAIDAKGVKSLTEGYLEDVKASIKVNEETIEINVGIKPAV